MLGCLSPGTRTGALLFPIPSGDTATPGVTELRSCIASLKQHLQAGEERRKARESEILSRLSATDDWI